MHDAVKDNAGHNQHFLAFGARVEGTVNCLVQHKVPGLETENAGVDMALKQHMVVLDTTFIQDIIFAVQMPGFRCL